MVVKWSVVVSGHPGNFNDMYIIDGIYTDPPTS